MVINTSLNCTPIRSDIKNLHRFNARPAFGSDEAKDIEEPKDTVEVNQQEDITQEEAPKKTDRRFNIKNAGKQFWQGVTSPIRAVIDNPAIAGAAVAGGFLLKNIVDKYPRVGMFSLAGTLGIAGYNGAKGVYKFAKADDAKEKEQSFYDMGQGTIYATFATLPAKAVAKANKDIIPNAESLKTHQALWANLKNIPKAVKDIAKALMEGKGLGTALGAGAVSAGTEALPEPGGADVSDIPITDPDNNVQVLKELAESSPEQYEQLLELARSLSEDTTGGFAVAAKTQDTQMTN